VNTLERRTSTARAQSEAVRRLRGTSDDGSAPAHAGEYAGLVTRTVALALDAIVVDGVAAVVGVTVGLGLGLLHLPEAVDVVVAAVLGAMFVIWSVGYFVFFWSSTGQTPGNRAMCIRVIDSRGRASLKPRRALLRFIFLCIGAILLLAGILMMLWDDQRRCLQDRVARTRVVYVAPSA
jgi:uncharacterized RDD family membrane protein YckC